MINLSLVVGDSWGAGVMGHNLVPTMASLTDIRMLAKVPPGHPMEKYCPPEFSPDVPYASDDPMLHLATGGVSFMPVNPNAWSWKRNVGWVYTEFPDQAKRNVPHVDRYYQHLVAGSTWCKEKLEELGLHPTVAIQGVDADVFAPKEGEGPKNDGKFYIFSGGKAEYRKGTDIVIAAYKILSQKYPDMHLIAAWGNLWLETMNSLCASKHIRYIPTMGATWKDRIQANLTINGISSDRYTLVDMVPNWKMPQIYRQAHIGLFPNRGEAGNNMPMCEAMACGIPIVATNGTGHSDVVLEDHAICIGGPTVENGWVEPELEEVVDAVEQAYKLGSIDREIMGRKGMEFIRKNLTWEKCAKDLLAVCEA